MCVLYPRRWSWQRRKSASSSRLPPLNRSSHPIAVKQGINACQVIVRDGKIKVLELLRTEQNDAVCIDWQTEPCRHMM